MRPDRILTFMVCEDNEGFVFTVEAAGSHVELSWWVRVIAEFLLGIKVMKISYAR